MTAHVVVGTGGAKKRFLRTKWPITEGLNAGTTKLPKKADLEAEDKSLLNIRDKVGIK